MVKRESKTDDAHNAVKIVEQAIGEYSGKDPAAVALGRMGGNRSKGG